MQGRPMAAQLNGAPVTNGGTESSAAMHAANGHALPKISDLDGKAPAPSDWANYFCTYAYLYHQVHVLRLKRPGTLPSQELLCRRHGAISMHAKSSSCRRIFNRLAV